MSEDWEKVVYEGVVVHILGPLLFLQQLSEESHQMKMDVGGIKDVMMMWIDAW